MIPFLYTIVLIVYAWIVADGITDEVEQRQMLREIKNL